jgi:hypothetical protein
MNGQIMTANTIIDDQLVLSEKERIQALADRLGFDALSKQEKYIHVLDRFFFDLVNGGVFYNQLSEPLLPEAFNAVGALDVWEICAPAFARLQSALRMLPADSDWGAIVGAAGEAMLRATEVALAEREDELHNKLSAYVCACALVAPKGD